MTKIAGQYFYCVRSDGLAQANRLMFVVEDEEGNVIDRWATTVEMSIAYPELFRHRVEVSRARALAAL